MMEEIRVESTLRMAAGKFRGFRMMERDVVKEGKYRRYTQRVLSLLPCRGKGRRLLDVGCGFGYLVYKAQCRGFDAEGVDLNQEQVKYGQVFLNANIHQQNFFTMNAGQQQYDVLVLNHFLEHFNNPTRVLMKARELLKPDGLLVVVTPNVGGFIPSFLKRLGNLTWWPGYSWGEHRILYTPETLRFLLHNNKFQVREVKTYCDYDGRLYPLVWPLLWLFGLSGVGDNMVVVGCSDG